MSTLRVSLQHRIVSLRISDVDRIGKRSMKPVREHRHEDLTCGVYHIDSDGNPAVPDRNLSHPVAGDEAVPSLQSSGAISGPGPGDDDALYAGWNYGDRWA